MSEALTTAFERAAAYLEDARVGVLFSEHNAKDTNEPISIHKNGKEFKFPVPISTDLSFFIADYSYFIRGRIVRELGQIDDRPVIEILKACYEWIREAMAESSTLSEAKTKFYGRLREAEESRFGKKGDFLRSTRLDTLMSEHVRPGAKGGLSMDDVQFSDLMRAYFGAIARNFFESAGDYKPDYRISQDLKVRSALKL